MSEASAWNQLANRYDKTVKFFDKSYPEVRKQLRTDLKGCQRVLEIAAGTGQFTFDLAKVSDRLVTTDISSEMIQRLDRKIVDRGIQNIEASVMSAYEVPFDDNEFDAVFCANALHVMETPQKALAEFRRILKPGACLVLPTFCHGIDWRRRFLSWLLSTFSPFFAHTKFTPESLEKMVREAGFDVEKRKLLPGKFPLLYLLARNSKVVEDQ